MRVLVETKRHRVLRPLDQRVSHAAGWQVVDIPQRIEMQYPQPAYRPARRIGRYVHPRRDRCMDWEEELINCGNSKQPGQEADRNAETLLAEGRRLSKHLVHFKTILKRPIMSRFLCLDIEDNRANFLSRRSKCYHILRSSPCRPNCEWASV